MAVRVITNSVCLYVFQSSFVCSEKLWIWQFPSTQHEFQTPNLIGAAKNKKLTCWDWLHILNDWVWNMRILYQNSSSTFANKLHGCDFKIMSLIRPNNEKQSILNVLNVSKNAA